MDHVVCLDSAADELENLIKGHKSMIIREESLNRSPFQIINKGDILYFINCCSEREVRAKGVVCSVLNSGKLTEEESFNMVIRHQDRLQLPDLQFEKWAGRGYLILIGVENIQRIMPFRIDKSNFLNEDDWLTLENIEKVKIS